MKPSELINKYSTRNDRKMKSICSPLEIFHVDCFWRYTLSEEGFFTYIGNIGPIGEYFFYNNCHINHSSFRSPKLLQASLILPGSDPLLEKSQEPIKEEFFMDQIMVISKKTASCYTGYCFATTHSQEKMLPIYVKNLSLFKEFTRYFEREAKQIILEMNDNQAEVASKIGDYFYGSCSPEVLQDDESEFLKRIGSTYSLSYQERKCIELLVRGFSCRQIAEQMQLSKRTIEHYLENIKNKWYCFSKQEIIDCALNNFFA